MSRTSEATFTFPSIRKRATETHEMVQRDGAWVPLTGRGEDAERMADRIVLGDGTVLKDRHGLTG